MKKLRLKTLYRSVVLERTNNIDTENRTVLLSFSSEEPYKRPFGIEVLDHSDGAVSLERLNNGAPLLLGHDTEKQIGVVEKAWLANKRGFATVRFSSAGLGKEVFQDVQEGIRRNVSVGYVVNRYEQETDNEKGMVFRAVEWLPLELSIVSVPADATVGIGRNAGISFEAEVHNDESDKAERDKVFAQYQYLKLKN